MSQVSYDHRAVTIDGRRTLLASGAIHYPRSTPAMWPDLMRRSREAGLNTVETYVFWNLHERRRGVLDFSDRLDLARFCRIAQAEGLHVILRIGPYICAETNYGGFPAWLRDVPGMRMRTWNPPFMDEMARWVRLLCEYLAPMFAPKGGPIILAQIENEYRNVAGQYGEDGQRYLAWSVELGQSLGLGVPWIMCHGAAPGAIDALNESCPHRKLDEHFRDYPDQPALSTELYPGWYDVYGAPRCTRSPGSLAHAVARFVAGGGTGFNYYMWHAGTNFGREGMTLQAAHYGFDAPLDEYGLETTHSRHMAKLHRLLADHADAILESERPAPIALGERQAAFVYGAGERRLVFLANDDEKAACDVTFEGKTYHLPPPSVVILGAKGVLLNTAEVDPACVIRRTMKPIRGAIADFQSWTEPMPADWPASLGPDVAAARPIEQLALTHDETDYCWYSATLVVTKREAGEGTLAIDRMADEAHVFVDGRLAATGPLPPKEDHGPNNSDDWRQEFRLSLAHGKHELAILTSATGLIKGDWMIGGRNMVEERKGIWGPVRWNGRTVKGPWRMRPGLVGERAGLCGEGGALAPWKAAGKGGRPLQWYRTTFARPKGNASLALDLSSMNKGLAWVNGRCVARYWLVPGTAARSPYLDGWLNRATMGKPTQTHYHVPRDWLAETNVLVLFEELGGDPRGIALSRWR